VRLEHRWLKWQEAIEALKEKSATPLLGPRGEIFFNIVREIEEFWSAKFVNDCSFANKKRGDDVVERNS
jgi:hypothetical protein